MIIKTYNAYLTNRLGHRVRQNMNFIRAYLNDKFLGSHCSTVVKFPLKQTVKDKTVKTKVNMATQPPEFTNNSSFISHLALDHRAFYLPLEAITFSTEHSFYVNDNYYTL